jgi:predicted rRNA methylase YqxC with S4 and FtsJ domains
MSKNLLYQNAGGKLLFNCEIRNFTGYFLRKNLLAALILLAVSFISLASLIPGISSLLN